MLEAFRVMSRSALGMTVDLPSLEAAAEEEHGGTRALLEHAIAAVYRNAGQLEAAEQHARAAVQFFAATDLITMDADTSLQLGDVLLEQGRREEARDVFERAEELYRHKGALVGADAVARRLHVLL
jgi:tetratricopeptide (TPR) repeat protein